MLTWSRIVIAGRLGTITLALTGQLRWPGRVWLPALLAAGLGQAVGYPCFSGSPWNRCRRTTVSS